VDSIWLPSEALGSKISPTQNVVETIPVCQGYCRAELVGGVTGGGVGVAVGTGDGVGVGVGVVVGSGSTVGTASRRIDGASALNRSYARGVTASVSPMTTISPGASRLISAFTARGTEFRRTRRRGAPDSAATPAAESVSAFGNFVPAVTYRVGMPEAKRDDAAMAAAY
jgi:hypothetical protein